MGVVLAFMSLASGIVLAYLAAVPFGAAAASALIASVTYLQEALAGERRVLGVAVFHLALRIGMSVAAIGGACSLRSSPRCACRWSAASARRRWCRSVRVWP
jgi:hypothetical protein